MLTYTELTKRQILSLLRDEQVSQFGTMNAKEIEIVPMFYVFTYEDDVLNLYFITSETGQKMDNMKDTGIVCTELIQKHRHHFDSVVANGNSSFVRNPQTKAMILRKFRQKYGAHHHYLHHCGQENLVFVQVNVSEITGRRYTI